MQKLYHDHYRSPTYVLTKPVSNEVTSKFQLLFLYCRTLGKEPHFRLNGHLINFIVYNIPYSRPKLPDFYALSQT